MKCLLIVKERVKTRNTLAYVWNRIHPESNWLIFSLWDPGTHSSAKAPVWGLFRNYLPKRGCFETIYWGVCFYLYYAKGRGAIQRGADKWHWFVVSKTLRNGLLHMQWHNHFWIGYDSVDCFGQHVTSWKGIVACQLEQPFAQIN